MSMGRLTVRTDRARKRFLGTLSTRCNVTAACRAAGISRQTAYQWRDDDPEFAEEWESAVQIGVDRLKDEAWRRGVDGVPGRPVTHKGKVVRETVEYSDRMLELLLGAHDPAFRRVTAADMLGGTGAFVGLVVIGPGGEAPTNGKRPGDDAIDVTPGKPNGGGNGKA